MKTFCKVILNLCIAFIMASDVYADSPPLPPAPYIVELGNNKLFYMTPLGQEDELHLKSGLYSGFSKPEIIYSFPKYLYSKEMYVSNDGRYVVDVKYWVSKKNSNTLDDETLEPAISFYEDGVLLKSYSLKELMKDTSKGIYTVSHIQWDYQDKRHINIERNELSTVTRDNIMLTFDLTTGLIQSNNNQQNYIGILLLISIIIFSCFALRKRLNSYRELQKWN